MTSDLGLASYSTGHELFDAEWLFGTYQMAALGFGQAAIEHPKWRVRQLQLMSVCIDRLLSPEVREFDRRQWGEDPLDSLEGESGHAAYLGYLNLVLGMHRLLDAKSPYAEINDRISAALALRFERSPTMSVETYPGQAFPVDMAAGIGSLGLHQRASGKNHRKLLRRWSEHCRSNWIEPSTGLLFQMVNPENGRPLGPARGSGTSLAAYFLSFADRELSHDLFDAMRRHMTGAPLGFGMAREYAPEGPGGRGDIDSGPVLFGYGVSATGFMLASCRIHGDRELYEKLLRTVNLFGAPTAIGDRLEFVTGGPIGHALLFALLPAQPVERLAGGASR